MRQGARGRLILVGLGQYVAQAVEAPFPRRALGADPLLEDGEACWLEAAGADAAGLFGANESALLEHLEVLGDAGQGDAEWCGEMGDRARAAAQAFHDR